MNAARMRLPGHPDAVCDLVAESLVDEYTRRDPASRTALSVIGGKGALFVAGDVLSKADFDVAQVIDRTLGSLGVLATVEPFVSLERVGERTQLFSEGSESPVFVSGYATSETPERIPVALAAARRIAQALESRRNVDEEWFWLGCDGDVFVDAARNGLNVSVRVEHGSKPLEEVRAEIAELIRLTENVDRVRVNELGSDEARGIGSVMGASGRGASPYGFLLPGGMNNVGLDMIRPEKGGAWLARAAARRLIGLGAKAAIVHAVYHPGERTPATVLARDERGRDLSSHVSRESLSLDRVAQEWWRPQLHADAARWGYAGSAGLPWEIEI